MCSNSKYEYKETIEPCCIFKFGNRAREDKTQWSIDSSNYVVTKLPALYSQRQVCQVHVLQHPYTEEFHLRGM